MGARRARCPTLLRGSLLLCAERRIRRVSVECGMRHRSIVVALTRVVHIRGWLAVQERGVTTLRRSTSAWEHGRELSSRRLSAVVPIAEAHAWARFITAFHKDIEVASRCLAMCRRGASLLSSVDVWPWSGGGGGRDAARQCPLRRSFFDEESRATDAAARAAFSVLLSRATRHVVCVSSPRERRWRRYLPYNRRDRQPLNVEETLKTVASIAVSL